MYSLYLLFQENKSFGVRTICIHPLMCEAVSGTGIPSQEEYKIIFSSLKICKMALPNQIDFLAFFRLSEMTYRNVINSRL